MFDRINIYMCKALLSYEYSVERFTGLHIMKYVSINAYVFLFICTILFIFKYFIYKEISYQTIIHQNIFLMSLKKCELLTLYHRFVQVLPTGYVGIIYGDL